MDSRIREHAATVVDHSTGIEAGDNVVISAPSAAEDFVVALYERCAEREAHPITLYSDSRATRGFLTNHTTTFDTPEHLLALYEEMDVYIAVRGDRNATETADIDPDTNAEYRRAMQPVLQERLSKTWCLTQYPTSGNAQLAGMSTDAYQEFVWNAVRLDWEAQRSHQAEMVERLNAANEVRITSGEETELKLSIEGNVAINDYGEKNLPGGEVFTAPVKTSVSGTVHFDMPLYRQGREIRDVRLEFENGRITAYSAERNEAVLDGIFATDDGAMYLGELGIGMNRAIDTFSYNMLFDEKMGDTVHLAVGSAYPETVGERNEVNESAEHVDMIIDMSEDSEIRLDDEVIQRNGTFQFEDGFAHAQD